MLFYVIGYITAVTLASYLVFRYRENQYKYISGDSRNVDICLLAGILVAWPITGPVLGAIFLGKHLGDKHRTKQ